MKRALYPVISFFLAFTLSTQVNGQVPSYVPTSNLIGWYPFSGNANNAFGTGKNGSVMGPTLTTDRFGNANSAYHFNGSSDHITIDTTFFNVGWSDYTISVWLNLDTLNNPYVSGQSQMFFNTMPHNGIVLTANHSSSNRYVFFVNSNPPTMWTWNILSYAGSSATLTGTAHLWRHLVFEKKTDTNYYVYINGLLDTSFHRSTTAVNYYCKVLFGRIDTNSIYSPEAFWGKLDDYGIWNRALSQCEIAGLYAGASTAITGPTTVATGGTITLSDSLAGGVWSSSNTAIATVGSSTGVVTGVSSGTVTISYTFGGCVNTITITTNTPCDNGIVSTIAGTGSAGYGAEFVPAVSSALNYPYGICVDTMGNVYIGDGVNNRVRMIDMTGLISTIAGTGTASLSGDGGPATAATFYGITGLAIDAGGNIYVADQDNQRIRKISTVGIVTCIAGSGPSGISGGGYSGDGGPATLARLNYPTNVAVDASGNVYIADQYNNRVRKIDAGGTITTIGGNGTSGYSGDGAAATAAQLNHPSGVAVDGSGNVYFSDDLNHRVRKISTAGIITTVAGGSSAGFSGDGGPATAALLNNPWGVFAYGGNVYIADPVAQRVRRIDAAGVITTIAGTGTAGFSGDGGQATAAKFYNPSGIFVDGTGDIYIGDLLNQRVRKIQNNNHPPVLTGGHTHTLSVCGGTISLDSLLIATDADLLQHETWSIASAPAHGTAIVSYTTTSMGSPMLPSGLSYTPATGYTGYDTFKVRVTDCMGASDTTRVYVVINTLPTSITGPSSFCAGGSVTYTDASVGGTWSSGTTAVATIGSATGIATGISIGFATITYTLPTGCLVTKAVTVYAPPGPVTGLSTTCVGGTTTLYDAGGGTWASGMPGIGTIGSLSGIVSGISTGTTLITYSTGAGCTATFMVTVYAAPVPISGSSNLCLGNTTLWTDGVTGGYWTSTAPVIASVGSASGVVTGMGAGTTTITYAVASGAVCSAVKTITVDATAPPITGIPAVCMGMTTTLYSGTGGTWSSGATGIATVGSASGIVIGVSAGTATITYSLPSGCTATQTVTVYPNPSPISGSTHVCVGTTTTLACTGSGFWSSSAPLVADVGIVSGVVTGIAAGTAIITYTLSSGCVTTMVMTVDASPPAITGTMTTCPGATTTLSDAMSGGTWSSGSTGIALAGSGTGIISGIAAGVAVITYSAGVSCITTAMVTVNPLPAMIAGPPGVCEGLAITLTDATPGGTWSSSSTGTASVSVLSGVVTGVSAGGAIITYTAPTGCMRTRAVIVNPLPAAISGPSALCVGSSAVLTTSSGGGTWSSSSTTTATITSSSGIVTGVATGTTIIDYVLPTGCSTTKTVTVSLSPGPIAGPGAVCTEATITLTDVVPGGIWTSSTGTAIVGSSSGIVTGVAAGTSLITYSLGTGCTVTRMVTVAPSPAAISGTSGICVGDVTVLTDPTPGGTWSGSTGIASVSSVSGMVTGLSTGITTVTYTVVSGCSATMTISVNAVPAAITGPVTVCTGSAITEADATPGGVWSSVSPGITIAGSSGVVTGIAAGAAMITYTTGGCRVTRTLTVNPVSAITGATGICIGATTVLTSTIPGGTWSSSMTSIATVGTGSGMVTGIAAGTATITYTLPTGCITTATVTVNTGPSAITGSASVCIGATTILSDITGGGTWSSSSGVATVGSSSGIVTGVAAGYTTITYSLGTGCTATITVTVNPNPISIIGPTAVCVGSTITLSDATPGGTWSGTPGTVATGSGTGIVTGIAPGTATVSYTLATGCAATKIVTVNTVPGTITGTASVCIATTTTLACTPTGGAWSSGSTGVATVSSGGVVTGVAAGVATITYATGAGCLTTRVVTVNPLPPPITGTASVCVGAVTTLSDVVSGGVWTSADAGIAAIVPATGVVTGVSAGTVAITYQPGAGCSVTRTVTVNPLPAVITGPGTVCIGSSVTLSDVTTGGLWSSSTITVATIGSGTGILYGVSVGTSVITYTSASGCSITQSMTVNPLPPGITGSHNVCAGMTISLSDPATGGMWSSGATGTATVNSASGTVTGVSGGMATISYTLPTGCAATYMVSVIAVPAITGLSNMCAWGDTLTVHDADLTGLYNSTLVTVLNLGSGAGRISAHAPGTATINYVLPSGCLTSRTFTVNPLPAAITGTMHFCLGTMTTLHESSPGGVWSSGAPLTATVGSLSGVVNGLAVGTAHIAYTLPTGCKTDTTVMVEPLPSAITVMSSTVIIGSMDLFSHAIPGGVWSSANTAIATVGSSSGIVTGVSLGATTISYTIAGYICPATRMVTVVPMPSIHPAIEDVVVIPNPNKGAFMINGRTGNGLMNVGTGYEDLLIVVTDVTGREVYRRAATIYNGRINEDVVLPGGIAAGTYLLVLRNEDGVRVCRVMVE